MSFPTVSSLDFLYSPFYSLTPHLFLYLFLKSKFARWEVTWFRKKKKTPKLCSLSSLYLWHPPSFITSIPSLASIMKDAENRHLELWRLVLIFYVFPFCVWSLISTISSADSTAVLSTSQTCPGGQGGDVLYGFEWIFVLVEGISSRVWGERQNLFKNTSFSLFGGQMLLPEGPTYGLWPIPSTKGGDAGRN